MSGNATKAILGRQEQIAFYVVLGVRCVGKFSRKTSSKK
jgi:hypothetical protein